MKRFVDSRAFQNFYMVVILLNVVQLSLVWYKQPQAMADVMGMSVFLSFVLLSLSRSRCLSLCVGLSLILFYPSCLHFLCPSID